MQNSSHHSLFEMSSNDTNGDDGECRWAPTPDGLREAELLQYQSQYPPLAPNNLFQSNLQPIFYQNSSQMTYNPCAHFSGNQNPELQRIPEDSEPCEFVDTAFDMFFPQAILVGSGIPPFNDKDQSRSSFNSSLVSQPSMKNLIPPRVRTPSASPTPSLLPRKRETKDEREERKRKEGRDKRMQQINEYINRIENKTTQDLAGLHETIAILRNLETRVDGLVGSIRRTTATP